MGALEDLLANTRHVGPEANDALLALMAHIPMHGPLVLSTRRDPDFFALYDIQGGFRDVIHYDDGAYAGLGAVLVRDGWLDGEPRKVGYLGDLRTRGASKKRALFPAVYAHVLEGVRAQTGCDAYLTGILAENAIAIASLTKPDERRKAKRAPMPHYALMRRYDMASIQVLAPPALARLMRGARAAGAIDVRAARPDDVPALAAFLHEDHRQRPFGYRFDQGELEHRLAKWPGFSLDDTFIARAADGTLLACATAWDPSPVKRYRVERYAGSMRALELGMRVASTLLRCPPLPRVGEDFRTLYLVNLSVRDDDPLVLRALLEAIYPHAWRKRAHFVALPLWSADDPQAGALGGYLVQRLAFHLYGVSPSAAPRTEWQSGRPGFEIALA